MRYALEQETCPCFPKEVAEETLGLGRKRDLRFIESDSIKFDRRCLACNRKFVAQGRYNRVCFQCKNKNKSVLSEFELSTHLGAEE